MLFVAWIVKGDELGFREGELALFNTNRLSTYEATDRGTRFLYSTSLFRKTDLSKIETTRTADEMDNFFADADTIILTLDVYPNGDTTLQTAREYISGASVVMASVDGNNTWFTIEDKGGMRKVLVDGYITSFFPGDCTRQLDFSCRYNGMYISVT